MKIFKDECPTLREYIIRNCRGPYDHFIFEIYGTQIVVSGIFEFERLYKEYLLDKYCVVKDEFKGQWKSCDYYCDHYLTLEEIEKEDKEDENI